MSERLTKVMNDPSYGGCGGVILARCENCTTRLSSCYEEDCGKQVEANKKLAIIENMLYDADGNEVISLSRLRELAEAERDGRVVIAPKKGDKLYYAPYPKGARDCRGELFFLRNCGDGSGIVESVSITIKFDNWSGRVPIKKTWRTLEEAEAARALSEKGGAAP